MTDKLRFLLKRLGERLWIKPLAVCLLSIAAAFCAQVVDQVELLRGAPEVGTETIEKLLNVISSSMLVISVFAVASMLAAYQSASSSATPRAFTLVLSDDVSQNALSTFIGAFIFSIVAQVALINGYYGRAGRFTLFLITILAFTLVILSFIRWVDRIARLGRVGPTIDRVEEATHEALTRRKGKPFLGGVRARGPTEGLAVRGTSIGYVQQIDMAALQAVAENSDLRIQVAVLPGTFVTPAKPLAYLRCDSEGLRADSESPLIIKAFTIDRRRTFDDDPRFGLVVLSEIASRALSPAVNDPGTAIEIIGSFVRLFTRFAEESTERDRSSIDFDRIAVPEIHLADMLDDAFHAIARDGAGNIEVLIWLQKALATLACIGNRDLSKAALECGRLVEAHAEQKLKIPNEMARLRAASDFCRTPIAGGASAADAPYDVRMS